MLNKTDSIIVIKMRNIDHANALEKVLRMLPKDTGGDCVVSVGGISVMIGHDVNVKGISHIKGSDDTLAQVRAIM